MTRRAEQYEQDERAKARARVNQSPITEATDAHSMGKIRAGSISSSSSSTLNGLVLLETITEEEVTRRNDAAYNQVLEIMNRNWKVMQVKRRFDRSQ